MVSSIRSSVITTASGPNISMLSCVSTIKLGKSFSLTGLDRLSLSIIPGEISEAYLFVAALGASNYAFVRLYPSMELRNWIQAHCLAFEFFGGTPVIVVPDNLKTGITKPNYYDPDLNPTYADMARHYDVIVLPARVRKPNDKAKVESAVLHVERRILAALRDYTFFSVDEANDAIATRSEQRTISETGRFKNDMVLGVGQTCLEFVA
jgi:transposase